MPPTSQRLKLATTPETQVETHATPQLVLLRPELASAACCHQLITSWNAKHGFETNQIEIIELIEEGSGLSIGDVRSVKQALAYSVSDTRYRHVVVHVMELGSVPAQQALLKLLEEPAARTQWWLTTYNQQSILPTIQSRCQIWSISQLMSSEELKELEVMSAAQQPDAEISSSISRLLHSLPNLSYGALVDETQTFTKRDQARLALTGGLNYLHAQHQAQASNHDLVKALDKTLSCLRYLDANVSPRMVLEHWLFSLKPLRLNLTEHLEKGSAQTEP